VALWQLVGLCPMFLRVVVFKFSLPFSDKDMTAASAYTSACAST